MYQRVKNLEGGRNNGVEELGIINEGRILQVGWWEE